MSQPKKQAFFFGTAPLPGALQRVPLLMDALAQTPSRITLGPGIHLDFAETSIATIGAAVAAQLADTPDRQRLGLEGPSRAIMLDSPVRDLARDELGWSIVLRDESASPDRVLHIAESWNARSWIVVADPDGSGGRVELVSARANGKGPFTLEGGRVSVSGDWITAEPLLRTREWDRTAYALIARLRRGDGWPEHQRAPSEERTCRDEPVERRPGQAANVSVPSYLKRSVAEITAPDAPATAVTPPRRLEPFTASTAPLDLEHMRNATARGPTPFSGATTPERLTELREDVPATPPEPLPHADETAMLMPSAALQDIIAAPAHPFQPQPPTAPARPSHAESLAAVTAPLDLEHLGALRARGPTPFSGSTTPARLSELRQEAAAASPPPSSDGAHPGTDETAMHMPSAAERAAFATLPFTTPAAPASPPPRELTLDELASLAAQLQARPASPEVFTRFGIATPADLLAVHADQERRFAADPSLRAVFEERRAHFLSFMKKEPRR